MLKKILVPLDGSNLAECALDTACRLAEGAGGELFLLRVTQADPAPLDFGQMPLSSPEDWQSATVAYLEALAQRLAHPGLVLDVLAAEGDPASLIVETAVTAGVDLIVMSTHGYSGLTRWLMGSVTEKVLQQAPCPVLVMRSAELPHKILIPLDGSRLAESALQPGLELAQLLPSPIHLLSVAYEPSLELLGFDPTEPLLQRADRAWNETAFQRAETYLQDVQAQLQRTVAEVTMAVRYGPPASAILEYAEQNDIQLILMATHGLTGIRRWVFGSVTHKVLRAASCALCIVSPKPAAR